MKQNWLIKIRVLSYFLIYIMKMTVNNYAMKMTRNKIV